MQRVSKAAAVFISRYKPAEDIIIRFDLIIFNNILSLNHIKNAWHADEK